MELLPESPEKLRLRNQPGNVIRVEWEAPPYDTGDGLLGDPATSYRIYISANGYGFTDAVTTSNAYYDVTGLEDGETIFVKVTAVNPGGESFPTPVLAARVPPSGSVVPLLFVDGFDRIDKYALIYQWESSAL